jgi:hypothetical protein
MKDNNLIFLICQPRSGSSMIQQLLLNSEEIDSVPEPWQMLSLVHTYKVSNIQSNYNPNYTAINYVNYLESTENGLIDFKEKIKELALDIYSKQTGFNHFFLDKTPRYYHIIEELYDLFPNAKFIFLVRNPLAVFASILDYNFNGDYRKMLASNDRLDDLFLAPKLIHKQAKSNPNCITLKYEDVLSDTANQLSRVFEYLNIDMPKASLNYKIDASFQNTNAVDSKSLDSHSKPTSDYLNAWKTSIDSTQKQRLAQEYLKKIDANLESYFDYNLKEIEKTLMAHKPTKNSIFNLGLEILKQTDSQLSLKDVIKKRVFLKLKRE